MIRHLQLSCLLFCISLLQGFSQDALKVTDLRCESVTEPLGIDIETPHLSWRLESATPGQKQTSYHVLVASSAEKLKSGSADLWDSGKIVSEKTQHVAYEGVALQSKQEVHWQVRVWGHDGGASDWSSPAQWTMGLLDPDDWDGQWIARSLVAEDEDEIIIQSAYYQSVDQSVVVDVKDAVKKLVSKENGFKVQAKTLGLKEDIAPGAKKELVVKYTKNGAPETLRLAEKKTGSFFEQASPQTAIHFRKEFTLDRVPDSAMFTVNSLFIFEVYVNGQKVGEDVLTPAISNTESRSFSVSYDLKPLLEAGNNCVGIWLGPNPLHYSPSSEQFAVRAQLDAMTNGNCLLYTSPSPRDRQKSGMAW